MPELDLDGIDLVLHAGDFTYRQKNNYLGQLNDFEQYICPWIENIAKHCPVYFTLGNHETFWEALGITENYNSILREHLLLHTGVILPKFDNLIVWGFPYTNRYGNWGFNVDDRPEDMGRLAGQIPTGTNVIISHGPVYGINDYVDFPHEVHAGSKELLKRVNEIQPQIFLSGHLHCDRNYEIVKKGKTQYVGCSIANEKYEMIRKPIIVEL